MSSDKIYPKGTGTFDSTGNSGKVVFNQDDLTDTAVETIGSYLNQKTRGVSEAGRTEFQGPESANYFPISEDRDVLSVIEDGTGKPYGPTTTSQDDGFTAKVAELEEQAVTYFNNLSKGYLDGDGAQHGGTFVPDEQPDKRGQEDGHGFLNKDSPISAVLAANRFSKMSHYSENPYLVTQGDGSAIDTVFRDFAPIDSKGARTNAQTFRHASDVKKLANIGSALLLAAAGDIEAGGNVSSAETSSAGNTGAGDGAIGAIFSGDVATGIVDGTAAVGHQPSGVRRIDVNNFDAKSYEGNGQDSTSGGVYTEGSFGTMNSYMDPFIAKAGSETTLYVHAMKQLLALLVMLIGKMLIIELIILIATGVALIVSAVTGTSAYDAIFATPGQMPGHRLQKGRSRGRQLSFDFDWFNAAKVLEGGIETVINAWDTLLDFLDITKPIHVIKFFADINPLLALLLPFTQATLWGWIQVFMGHLTDFGQSSGYWVAITRGIMRSEAVKGDFLKIGPSSGPGGFAAIYLWMRTFRDSSITGLIRTLAELGNIAISSGYYGKYTFAAGGFHKPARMLPDSPAYRHYKMRDSRKRSSVRTAAAPSMMMLSLHTVAGAKMMRIFGHDVSVGEVALEPNGPNDVLTKRASDKGFPTNAPALVKLSMATSTAVPAAFDTTTPDLTVESTDFDAKRFSPDQVKLLEDAFEAEYVPFYFHDLRTNEIIGFHAFLNSISDGYSAEYNKAQGFGRIEPAMIYGGSSRSISFDFTVWAMDRQDFDEMWWKINKLTTLMYPQWSQGMLVNYADTHQFTVPFSQVPTASPLCRVRIGDLFTSNYSKFSLARLHGVDSGKFIWAGNSGETEAVVFPPKAAMTLADQVKAAKDAMNDVQGAIAKAIETGDPTKFPLFTCITCKPGDYIANFGVNQPIAIESSFKCMIPAAIPTGKNEGSKSGGAAEVKGSIIAMLIEGEAPKHSAGDAKPIFLYVKMSHILSVDAERTANYLNEMLFGPAELGDPTTSPFASANNPIVKAFDSTAGRGLAGVIEGMDFDWDITAIPWETTEVGNKGPMGCRVSVKFQPIHDITPGIDAYGVNRAPIYGIGTAVNALRGDPHEVGDVRGSKVAAAKGSATVGEASDTGAAETPS